MLLHDLPGEAKANARTVFAGSKKRDENLVSNFFGYARTIVSDPDFRLMVRI
jgi:hypothetical protein